jgi:hypothetical protein
MKHQNIKTSPITAIEALTTSPDNQDLELIGQSPLVNVSKALASAVKAGVINDSISFSKIFGYETNFYYIIECVTNEKVTSYERGIGYIYQQDNRTFLKREIPIANGKNAAQCISSSSCGTATFNCCDSDCTVLYSCVPHSLVECFPFDNTILASQSRFTPQPVSLQQNCLLGRLDDNLQSIPLDNETFIDKIVNAISKFTKQIKLKTSKLSLKRIECETIDLLATSNIRAKKGSLYYDESDDTIKVYNGNEWKTIAFVKD